MTKEAELPPEQVEPVDLSVKIRIETVPKKEDYRNFNSAHVLHPKLPVALPVHQNIKLESTIEANNNIDVEACDDKNEEPVHTSLSLPPLTIVPNVPPTQLGGAVPLSSQYFVSSPTIASNIYNSFKIAPGTSLSYQSPPRSPSITCTPVKSSINNNTTVSAATSSKELHETSSANKYISQLSQITQATDHKKESVPPKLTPSSYSGTIITSPLDPAAILHQQAVALRNTNGLSIAETTKSSNSSPIPNLQRIIPPTLSESLVISPLTNSPIPPALAIPTPHLSPEALATLMKDHHTQPHFPLHLAHLHAAGFHIPLPSLDKNGNPGKYILNNIVYSIIPLNIMCTSLIKLIRYCFSVFPIRFTNQSYRAVKFTN